MQTTIAIIFWVSLGLTLYAVVGYPLLLRLLSRLLRKFDVREAAIRCDDDDLPQVSVVLPILGDDRHALDRVQNLLASDFPVDRMEIVVGCAARDDLVADLISTLNDPRVRSVQCPPSQGAANLINACLAAARNNVVLLTDCDVRFDRQTIRRLASHFRSPHVGGACGRLVSHDGATWEPRSASFVHSNEEFETRFGVAPVSGGCVAAFQAELVGEIPDDVQNAGLYAVLKVYRSGLQVVFDGQAVARRRSTTFDASIPKQIGIGRLASGLREAWAAFRWIGCSRAVWVLFSRWLRQCAPAFVAVAMLSNAILAGDPFYLRLLILHELAYLVLLIHLCLRERGKGEKCQLEPGI